MVSVPLSVNNPPPEHRPALTCAFLSRKSEILILQLVVLRIREDGTAADY